MPIGLVTVAFLLTGCGVLTGSSSTSSPSSTAGATASASTGVAATGQALVNASPSSTGAGQGTPSADGSAAASDGASPTGSASADPQESVVALPQSALRVIPGYTYSPLPGQAEVPTQIASQGTVLSGYIGRVVKAKSSTVATIQLIGVRAQYVKTAAARKSFLDGFMKSFAQTSKITYTTIAGKPVTLVLQARNSKGDAVAWLDDDDLTIIFGPTAQKLAKLYLSAPAT